MKKVLMFLTLGYVCAVEKINFEKEYEKFLIKNVGFNLKGEEKLNQFNEVRKKTIKKFSIAENSLSDEIVNILLHFRKDIKFLRLSSLGRGIKEISLKSCLSEEITNEGKEFKNELKKLSEKIKIFVDKAEAIVFYGPLLSFRGLYWKEILGDEIYKKVTWAEILTLETINTLLKKIQSIYTPGAKIKLYSDGYIFEQCFGVENLAKPYMEMLNDIIKKREVKNIEIILPDYKISNEKIEEINRNFSDNNPKSNELILVDYYDEYFPDKQRPIIKSISYCVEKYASIFSEYIKKLECAQNSIRISIHEGKECSSTKLPLNLLWGSETTACHAFPFIDIKGNLKFLTSKDIQDNTLVGRFASKKERKIKIKEQDGFLYAQEIKKQENYKKPLKEKEQKKENNPYIEEVCNFLDCLLKIKFELIMYYL